MRVFLLFGLVLFAVVCYEGNPQKVRGGQNAARAGYNLEEAAEAHHPMKTRQTTGKIVLLPAAS